jgi:hypothetical protein
MTLDSQQREDLRHAVAETMALRYPAALSPRRISRAAAKELAFQFEEADVIAALELLKGLKLADSMTDGLGSTNYWRATSECVLKVERREI